MEYRRQRLGARLRDLREANGLTLVELARQVGWSRARLSRLERAEIRPTVDMVMDLLDALRIEEPDYSDLVRDARASGREGWWRSYDDAHQAAWSYAELEANATAIQACSAAAIPGLLQTQEYATFRIRSTRRYAPVNVESNVAMRAQRQQILGTVDYTAVIDEAALRRALCPVDVLREQLLHLIELMTKQTATVHILPLDQPTDDFVLAVAPFIVFESPNSTEVLVEWAVGSVQLAEPYDVPCFQHTYHRLRDAALGPEQSIEFLRTLERSL